MTLHIEGQPNWKVTPPRRRRGAAAETVAESVLPDCLQSGVRTGHFEVVEEAQLQGPALQPPAAARRGARRKGTEEAALTVALDQPAGEPYVVVARQESGAISFHIPQPAEAPRVRGGRRGAKAAAPLTVRIPIGGGAPEEETTKAPRRRGTRGVVDKAVRVVVLKVANAVANATMEVLGRKLEEQLWKKGQRQEGWVRVELGSNGQATCHPGLPEGDLSGRSLLLLHGTFSHTAAAFGDLLGDRDTALRLKALYGDRIFGFDHFTISKTPGENVAELLAALPAGLRLTCDVITHSRGGLVLRTLHQELTRGSRPDPRVTLGRVVLVASPNGGTPLATPERWEQTLGWFANLLEMVPENALTTAAGWISGSLSWLAQGLNRNLPGIQAMDANGETVQELAQIPLTSNDEWYGLVADTQVPTKNGLAARLADMGVDAFFDGPNDLVVPTEGGREWGASPPVMIPDARVGRFAKPGGNLPAPADALVMHTTLFAQPATQKFIADMLQTPAIEAAIRAALPPSQLPMIVPGVQPGPAAAAQPFTEGEAKSKIFQQPDKGPASTLGGTSQTVESIRNEADEQTWSRQDSLMLVVLEAPDEVSGTTSADLDESKAEAIKKVKKPVQLLAMYDSATVLVPFGKGIVWQKVFAKYSYLKKYIENSGDNVSLTSEQIEEVGSALFQALFSPPVRFLYDQARFRERSRKLNVHFCSLIPWIADLPWELAFDQTCHEYLSLTDVRFVRGSWTPLASDRIETRAGAALKILLVAAQPGDAVRLDLSTEVEKIKTSLKDLVSSGKVSIEVLMDASIDDLHSRMRRAVFGEIDVVHFMGHGGFDHDKKESGYLFFNYGSETQPVKTEHLCAILRSRGIKIVFLNACESGKGGHANYNSGVAPGLMAAGIPAVVANQYPVFDNAAIEFARLFYNCLTQGLPLGDAARESRIALRYRYPKCDSPLDWAVPVLFTRNPDAVLCSRR